MTANELEAEIRKFWQRIFEEHGQGRQLAAVERITTASLGLAIGERLQLDPVDGQRTNALE